MYKYKAFGFIIESEIEIIHIPYAEADAQVDVRIVVADLQSKGYSRESDICTRDEMCFCPKDLAILRVTDGKLIEVEPLHSGKDQTHLTVFIMGSCMGAIIHQRGLLPLHGSCVTKEGKSVLIMGNSGAGKSTLASEFLNNGWKLLTDDVAIIKNIDEIPMVQSSYPSQKLWKDSLAHYKREDERVHTLYSRGQEDKYGVNVEDMFQDGTAPLSLLVRLLAAENVRTGAFLEKGFARIEQVRQNTYRSYMIDTQDQQKHFQRCVTLGTKIPLAVAVRNQSEQTAHYLYEEIVRCLDTN